MRSEAPLERGPAVHRYPVRLQPVRQIIMASRKLPAATSALAASRSSSSDSLSMFSAQQPSRIVTFGSLATKTPNRVPHVGGTAGVKVGQADDRDAGDIQLRDIGRRKGIRRFNPRRQTVSVGKLRKQHRCGFIERRAAREAEHGEFPLPAEREISFQDDRQVAGNRCIGNGFERGGGFGVQGGRGHFRYRVVLGGKIAGKFGHRIANLGHARLIQERRAWHPPGRAEDPSARPRQNRTTAIFP